ncbi:MAG: deoxyribodipyrimidine photo-lyase, partial [Candidatus Bathyarchaeota archaeon]|nr:deoxyribodipyrimidine photo-lyase [Candidatus Bathyarchaeota archaeon]
MDPFTDRIKFLNNKEIKNGKYIVYWMQASQRVEYNHALEYSILKANDLNLPLLVFFGLTRDYPDANERHYYFMLEGLKESEKELAECGIQLIILDKSPEFGAIELSKNASLMIVDRGYLKIHRAWREYVAKNIKIPLLQVESDVIVPVEEASKKEEYSAATIRHKIDKGLDYFMQPLRHHIVKKNSLTLSFDSLEINKLEDIISKMKIERSVKKVDGFLGGTRLAKKHLNVFIDKKLERYEELRNDPTLDYLSNMSPFLHFGQISPLYIALKVKQSRS